MPTLMACYVNPLLKNKVTTLLANYDFFDMADIGLAMHTCIIVYQNMHDTIIVVSL